MHAMHTRLKATGLVTSRSKELPLQCAHLYPGLPLRTMNALTWLVSLLRAQMMATSAHVALPIQRCTRGAGGRSRAWGVAQPLLPP